MKVGEEGRSEGGNEGVKGGADLKSEEAIWYHFEWFDFNEHGPVIINCVYKKGRMQ